MKIIILAVAMAMAFAVSANNADQYIQNRMKLAKLSEDSCNVPWQLMLAIGALESGWGSSVSAVNYNAEHGVHGRYFYRGRQMYRLGDNGELRCYPDLESGWIDAANVISSSSWFPNHKPSLGDPISSWVDWVSMWYVGPKAPDEDKRKYKEKINWIIKNYVCTKRAGS